MNDEQITIRSLSPELLDDFLSFFDEEAFADNPRWAFCYCQFLYVDHAKVDWKTRTATENREAACNRVRDSRMQGLLAYRGGRVVGWCNAAPREMMDALADEPDPDGKQIGEITCFVVAKPHRRSGVATALLEAACAGLRSQGLTIAEAVPKEEATTEAENHYGPLGMYLAAGFQVHRRDDDGTVFVRRRLA